MKNRVYLIFVVFVLFSCINRKGDDNYENANVVFDYYVKKRCENHIVISKCERLNYHASNVMFRDKHQIIYVLFHRNEKGETFIQENLTIRKDTSEKSFIADNHQVVGALNLEDIDSISYENKKIKLFKYMSLTKDSGPSYVYWNNDIGLIAIDNYKFLILLNLVSGFSNADELNFIRKYVFYRSGGDASVLELSK